MKLPPRGLPALLTAIPASVLFCLLIGCGSGVVLKSTGGSGGNPPPPPSTYPGVTFSGKVLAGSQPVATSSVQVYAAGTAGNGSAPAALLATAIATDTTGSFTVPAGYTCPAATSQLYVVASGGTTAPSTSSNASIAFFTALGPCSQLAASTQFTLNEATTVAGALAFAQFLAPGAQLGASASNTQGLANAVATFANLVNPATGTSPGTTFPAKATAAAPRINLLANLLNTCATSTSQVPCSQLFTSATSAGASAPATTLDAALALVRHPGLNVQTLYNQSTASTAFAPVPTAAPSDWTLFITYTGGGMNEPGGLGIDANGNVWVSSYPGVVSQFAPTGQPVSASGITGLGLDSVYGLAIDSRNNIWIPNENSAPSVNGGLGSVTEINSAGQPLSGTSGYSAGGFDFPIAIAIDPNATTWVIDYGNSHLTLLNASGQPLSGASGYTSSQFAFPVAIAIDASHNAWIANEGIDSITKVSPDGSQFTSYTCCNAPAGIAIDQTGNIWAANYYGNSVSEVAPSGAILSSGYASRSLDHPQGIAIDGSGNVWVASYRAPALTQIAGATSSTPGQILSPAAGWAPEANMVEAYALAIDPSGNIWVTDFGTNRLTEFIGLATPVKTPLLGPPQTP